MFKIRVVILWMRLMLAPRFASRERLIKYQQKKLKRFARKILSTSPFYKRYFNNGVFDWASAPMISKEEFMSNFDQINTVGLKKEDALKVALEAEHSRNFKSELKGVTIGLSTGTSGRRGLFLASEKERALWTALIMQRVIQPKFFKKQRIAFFLRANSNLYSSVASALFEFKYFDIFKPIEQLLKELNDFQPHILAAQPSILVDIARALQNKSISIHPNQIISFAEVLHANDKKFIQLNFDCRFTEVYQCTEGFLGVTCEQGTMHLNEDFMLIEKEVIDERRFFPIITDFSRESQPVIKYKLNDVLVSKQTPCICGSKLLAIEKIEGRDDDVLEFISENGLVKLYPDLIARRIAQETDSFIKYQLVQCAYDRIEIAVETNAACYPDVKAKFSSALLNLLKEHSVENVTLNFSAKITSIPGNKNRKIKKEFAGKVTSQRPINNMTK